MTSIPVISNPNLMRHIFPTYRVPKISFAESTIQVQVPREVFCVDVTFAQGLANLRAPSSDQATQVIELLDRMNNQSRLIRQVDINVAGDQDVEVVTAAMEYFCSGDVQIEPVAVVEATPVGVARIKEVGLNQIGLPFGVSSFHTHHAGKEPVDRTINQLLCALDECRALRIQPRLDLLDITRADMDRFVLPLINVCQEHLGAEPLRVRLCDSLGLGQPWSAAPVPRSIPRLVQMVHFFTGLKPEQVEFVGADDLGLALANTIAAVVHGCGSAATSMAGVGDRAGVAATELLAIHLAGLYGLECDLHAVRPILDIMVELGLELPPRHPLWGEDALTTSLVPSSSPPEGTEELYAPFNTMRLFGRAPAAKVVAASGVDGIGQLIRQELPGVKLEDLGEDLRSIHSWAVAQGLNELTWDDIADKTRELMDHLFVEGAQDDEPEQADEAAPGQDGEADES